MTDVRRRGTLADYDGELLAQVEQRITDRYSGNSQTEAATTIDIPLQVSVPCAATADPASGGDCAINTTLDALLPGTVRENARAIWQLGRVEVLDGGSDGDADTSADNTLFATQGVFVP
jgi:hypothetical protein